MVHVPQTGACISEQPARTSHAALPVSVGGSGGCSTSVSDPVYHVASRSLAAEALLDEVFVSSSMSCCTCAMVRDAQIS